MHEANDSDSLPFTSEERRKLFATVYRTNTELL